MTLTHSHLCEGSDFFATPLRHGLVQAPLGNNQPEPAGLLVEVAQAMQFRCGGPMQSYFVRHMDNVMSLMFLSRHPSETLGPRSARVSAEAICSCREHTAAQSFLVPPWEATAGYANDHTL